MIVKIIGIKPNLVVDGAGGNVFSGFLTIADFGDGCRFFALKVGETGKGRVQRFIPLLNRPVQFAETLAGERFHVTTIRLSRGQHGWFGEVVEDTLSPDGTLVLLETGRWFQGGFFGLPTLYGAVQAIEIGWCAQGSDGHACRRPQLMLLATGPARIEWHRSERIYVAEDWVAWTADGLRWMCRDSDTYGCACDAGVVPAGVQALEPVRLYPGR